MKVYKILFCTCLVPILLACSGCLSIVRYDGPYEGRVIDESGKPIERAVAHGTWSRIHVTPAGRSTEYYDSYETLTDKDGYFRIPGQGFLLFSNIDVVTLNIFKAGYDQFGPITWFALLRWNYDDSFRWSEDGMGIFKIKKLSMEERRKRVITLPSTPRNKQKLIRTESNKENLEIGESENTLLPLE